MQHIEAQGSSEDQRMTNKVITRARENIKGLARVNGSLHFSEKHKRPQSPRQHGAVSPSILLTRLVPDGFLNVGRGFSFILGRRWVSLNYLSLSSAASGGAVDLVKQLERGSPYMQITTRAPLIAKHLAGTLIQDPWRGYVNKVIQRTHRE